jgi:hypothetical protein
MLGFWMSILALALAGVIYLGALLDKPELQSEWPWWRRAG